MGTACDSRILSESELGCYLPDTRIVRVGYDAKASAVDQTAWRNELRMIKDIEELKAKLKRIGFCEMNLFIQRHVRVVQAWTAKESALGVPKVSQDIFFAEQRGVEIRASLSRIGLSKELARYVIRLIRVTGGAYRSVTNQRLVVVFDHGDREPA